jgi:hypothetical protein
MAELLEKRKDPVIKLRHRITDSKCAVYRQRRPKTALVLPGHLRPQSNGASTGNSSIRDAAISEFANPAAPLCDKRIQPTLFSLRDAPDDLPRRANAMSKETVSSHLLFQEGCPLGTCGIFFARGIDLQS